MSDYMLLEYLRNKGKHDDDYRKIDEFKDYMRARGGMRGSRRHRDYQWDDMDFNRHDWDTDYPMAKHMRGYRDAMPEGSFDEIEAKEIVSEMYHYEGDTKQHGEHFNMHKAKEVFEKYKSHFVVEATPCDVYVAINAFYHDLNKPLKMWFGSNIDEKVILLAITFWFKDDDYQGNKLMNYFM
jgi:hypothetical protein